MRHKWQGADYVYEVFYKGLKGRQFSAAATRANAGRTSKTLHIGHTDTARRAAQKIKLGPFPKGEARAEQAI